MESPEERSVELVALNNPIILEKIFEQSSATLKNCRLVCHFWNEIVLSLPNTRLVLNLTNKDDDYEKDPVPFFQLCLTLDERLSKRISCAGATYRFAAKLMHLCHIFSDQVQILETLIETGDYLPSIFHVFKHSCPNLKQFRINCIFNNAEDIPTGEILVAPLPQKPNLTVFELNSEQSSPALTSFIQLVVNASPNLRKVTLPWGSYPDLKNSKFLDSLTLKLDHMRPPDISLRDLKPLDLARLLNQVGDQLVHLSFSYIYANSRFSMEDNYDLDNSTSSGFRLPRKMSKLRTYKNDLIDIIQHADLWQDIVGMPALESFKIGKICKKSTSMDAILKKLLETKRILTNVTDLNINELYDPKLLEGLKTAFPNLTTLALDTFHKKEMGGMELGVVLKACAGLDTLNHFHLWLPTYPERMRDTIEALLIGRDLYKKLNSLVIDTYRKNEIGRDFKHHEMDAFKELLVSMKEMDQVIINDLYVGDETLRNVLEFKCQKRCPYRDLSFFKWDGHGWSIPATPTTSGEN
ncbi:uncharacterized protein LOC118437880 isoform X2 [Folsomia candida]|uniref:uncharacterized protein LOC118437880 isoform X2 n=1 Tax=Folsomia candida TaxID=158441 RepID=UPI0016052B31|nr:uncharacterized protein LOC118437880 isoform X2 [Folsomia candida]